MFSYEDFTKRGGARKLANWGMLELFAQWCQSCFNEDGVPFLYDYTIDPMVFERTTVVCIFNCLTASIVCDMNYVEEIRSILRVNRKCSMSISATPRHPVQTDGPHTRFYSALKR